MGYSERGVLAVLAAAATLLQWEKNVITCGPVHAVPVLLAWLAARSAVAKLLGQRFEHEASWLALLLHRLLWLC